ncbi:MAG: YkgJ family cysteine cluster protein [Deltaproteobacteria bacterium]|nr:YkgJ family cysteine cluster protein [Deltaproteobacteria bacterium]
MTTWALREGVRLEPTSEHTAALFDPLLGKRVKLDAVGTRLARALGPGKTTAALADELTLDEAAVARSLAALERLYMIDTPTSRALAADASATRRVQAMTPAEAPLVVRPEARFTCTMCGSCCGGHNVGPVDPDILDGLAPHLDGLAAASGRDDARGLFFQIGGEVGGQVLCHSVGGSCVFLTEDRKCRIHAELGGDKKPRPCRIFPYELIATPRGVAVTIQRECRGFPEARNGKLLSESLDELREVMALAGRLPIVRPIVKRLDGTVLDWASYEALEERLHALVDDASLSTSELLVALTRAVSGEPPGSAEPSHEGQRAELAAVADTIVQAMDAMLATIPAPDDRLTVKADGLAHARAAAKVLLSDWRRVSSELERPEQRSLLRDHLHHALMAKDLLLADTLEAGIARLVLEWSLAKALAIHRAREVKRRHLVTQDLMDGLVSVSFLFHHEHFRKTLLAPLDARLIALFGVAGLPALIARAAQVEPPRTATELVKF